MDAQQPDEAPKGETVATPPLTLRKKSKKHRARQRRRKRSRREVLRKEQWYRMTSFFENSSKRVMSVQDEDVLLCGWIPPDMDCGIVLVPPSVTQDQGLALEKIIEAQLRKPVLVMTNNTQLVRLKPITDALAKQIMEGEADAHDQVIQVSTKEKSEVRSGGETSSEEGPSVRSEDSERAPADLRQSGADSSDEDREGSEGSGRVSAVDEGESRSEE